MDKTLFRRLEAAGGVVVYAIASVLHFIYDLSGQSIAGALLGAVNESVWEHLKIFGIAYLIWSVTELLWAKPPLKAFVTAKAVGLYFLGISIAAFFYMYTFFSGRPILSVDLISSLIFSLLAHLISYKLTFAQWNRGQFFYSSIMLIFLALVMILCFTYYPPECPLFQDYETGLYGIISDNGTTSASVFALIPY